MQPDQRRFKVTNNQEAGITLLLAVLIVATLSIITTTVAFLAIQDIRQSRAVLYTEPALVAAQTGAEDAVWNLKRGVGTLNTCPSNSTAAISSARTIYCKTYGAATLNIQAGTPLTLYLYDPNNINGDIDLKSMSPGPYNTLYITNLSPSYTITANLTRLDGTPIGPQPVSVSPGDTQTVSGLNGIAGNDNRMQLVIQSSVNATVSVNTDQGMPAYPTIDATGCAAKTAPSTTCTGGEVFNRRLNITVPQ